MSFVMSDSMTYHQLSSSQIISGHETFFSTEYGDI